jgi:hypothetical protein
MSDPDERIVAMVRDETREHYAILTIDRPEARNALRTERGGFAGIARRHRAKPMTGR